MRRQNVPFGSTPSPSLVAPKTQAWSWTAVVPPLAVTDAIPLSREASVSYI